MLYLGIEPGAACWYVQTDPLSYDISLLLFPNVFLSHESGDFYFSASFHFLTRAPSFIHHFTLTFQPDFWLKISIRGGDSVTTLLCPRFI